MSPRFEILKETKLVGKRLSMSLTQNRTGELWRSFMPRRNEIQNKTGTDLFSLQIYSEDYFSGDFNPGSVFVKWAASEVSDFGFIPDGMESMTVPEGLYAIFLHQGPASDGPKIFGFIFGEWLPGSGYQVDDRPHFELLGEKYKNDDPASEEEIWIPVRRKNEIKP